MVKNFKSFVGNNIKNLRKAHGLTQSDLAERIGFSVRHLQNIEYGSVDIGLETLCTISEVFGVIPETLLTQNTTNTEFLTHLDFLPVGIQYCDHEGLVIYTNSTYTKFLGYTKTEIINRMYIWDFLHDHDEKEDLQKYLKYLIEERPKPTPYSSTNLTKQGEKIDVHCSWNYVLDSKKNVIGFLTTITEA